MEDDIIQDAYYLIHLFNEGNKEINVSKLCRLMYLFEAYYMNIKDVDSLYDCQFNAGIIGPVTRVLYKGFETFTISYNCEPLDIVLDDEDIKIGNKINREKKNLFKYFYNEFKDLSEDSIIYLVTMENSPWHKKWLENNRIFTLGEESYIDKLETKKWFKENFLVKDNTDE